MRASGDGGPRLGLDPRRRAPLRVERSGAPYLVPLAAALLAALAIGLGWKRIASCGAPWKSPESQVSDALAQQNRAQLADVYGFKSGGTADLFALRFADPAISVEAARATVAAMVDAQGRVTWREERAELRYLGREKFQMHPCAIAGWCGEGDQFERLRAVLAALFRRHDAAVARDPAALGPLVAVAYDDRGETRDALLARLAREWPAAGRPRVRAWQIRVERDGAEVGEDLEVERPGRAPAPARAVYRLAWEGGRWVFVAGL